MSTFICDCCDKEFEYDKYSMKILTTSKGSETVYFNKNTKEIFVCEKGSNLKPKDNSFKGVPMFQSYSSLSKQDQQKSLLKRSQEHFKKNIAEEKYERNKKAVEKFQNPD